MTTAARKRLMRDYGRLQNDPPHGLTASPLEVVRLLFSYWGKVRNFPNSAKKKSERKKKKKTVQVLVKHQEEVGDDLSEKCETLKETESSLFLLLREISTFLLFQENSHGNFFEEKFFLPNQDS